MSKLLHSPWRYLIWVWLSLLLLLMAALAAVSTFVATESGSRILTEWGLEQVSQSDGIVVSVDGIRGNLLQGLRLQGLAISTPDVDIRAQSLVADWNSFSLLGGDFQLARLEVDGIEVVVKQSTESTKSDASSPLANVSFSPLPIAFEVADFVVVNFTLLVEQRSSAEPVTLTVNRLQTGLSFRDIRIALDELHLESDIAVLDGDLTLDLGPALPITAQLRWTYLDALPLELENASGELSVGGSIEQLEITHRLASPYVVQSTGRISPLAAAGVEVDLQHNADRLVLPQEALQAELQQVRLTTSGAFPDVEFTLNTTVAQADRYPALGVSASGQLNGMMVNLNSDISAPTGALSIELLLDFSQGFSIGGHYTLQEDDPLALLGLSSEFPVANLNSVGDFQFNADGQSLQLELGETSAFVDDFEVVVAGGLMLQDGAWQIDGFTARSSANQMLVSGSYDEQIVLDWQLQAPQLEQFLPGISAVASGEGTLRGNLEAPVIDAHFSVEQLVSESATVRAMQLRVEGDVTHYEGQVQIQNAEFDIGSEPLQVDSANLIFSGSPSAHDLTLALSGVYAYSELAADLSLQGGFSEAFGSDWSGELSRSSLQSVAGNWQLLAPVDLNWADQQIQVADSCWVNESIRICVNVTPDASGLYTLEGSIADFPLQEFNALAQRTPLIALPQIPRLPEGVTIEGTATASVYAQFGAESSPRFNSNVLAENAVLTLSSGSQDQFGEQRSAEELVQQSYTWRRLSLQAQLEESQWQLDGRAQLEAANLQDDSLPISGELQAGLSIDSAGNLNGSSRAEFSNLGWVSALVPELRDVTGLLESRLAIAGNLQAPELDGELRINQAGFLLERTGVTYSDIELSLTGASIDSVTLEGSLASEEGFLTYFGAVQGLNTPGWHLEAEVEGENFWLSNTPELALQITPMLNLDANAQRIDLRGNLHVPLLDLVLQALPASAVDISRDVVIQNYPSERPELARSFTSSQTAVFDLPMSADLVLSLGDEVAFEGFGLQAALTGELEVQQQLTGASFTYGELAITEGHYRIYGQELTLQDGKLLFLGNYSNPALDIRAVREVQGQTVGVLINGTLNNMRSQLYSTPVLPDSEVLAVLVTGRPASQLRSSDGDAMLGAIARLGIEQGQSLAEDLGGRFGFDSVAITNSGDIDSSELTVGKYLTPQIFVRYGVGLFDSFSKVAVDYFINDRLTLQAESGEYQSIDFTYRVER